MIEKTQYRGSFSSLGWLEGGRSLSCGQEEIFFTFCPNKV